MRFPHWWPASHASAFKIWRDATRAQLEWLLPDSAPVFDWRRASELLHALLDAEAVEAAEAAAAVAAVEAAEDASRVPVDDRTATPPADEDDAESSSDEDDGVHDDSAERDDDASGTCMDGSAQSKPWDASAESCLRLAASCQSGVGQTRTREAPPCRPCVRERA